MPFHVLLGTLLSGGLVQGRALAGTWQANSCPSPPKKKFANFAWKLFPEALNLQPILIEKNIVF